MALKWPNKDPDEILDYTIDWSARLGTDAITTSLWIVPTGLTVNDETISPASPAGTATTVWLEGGTEGETYVIQNRVDTVGGRQMDQSVKLRVKTK